MDDATCAVGSCERLAVARGWCNTHYHRWRRNGDPTIHRTRWEPDGRACSVVDCDQPATIKKLCRAHYAADYNQRVIAPRRAAWIEAHGGRCATCGSQDRLEIDHIDPSTKTREIASVWALTRAARDVELAKCQILCRACHEAKTRAEFPAQHGTVGRWRKGCRCDDCHQAIIERGRKDRARQKTLATAIGGSRTRD